MAYLIRFSHRAERDFSCIYEDINAEASEAALIWYQGLKTAVLSLENHPARCPATTETDKLRHLLYGRKSNIYRVIFRILEKQGTVEILPVRHGARRQFDPRPLT